MNAVFDVEAAREDLEETKVAFHELLATIPPDAWTRKSANPDLTIREVVWHTAWAMSWMAASVDAVKAGKNLNLPRPLIEPARKIAMRWLARKATPEAAARKYDEGHAALLAELGRATDADLHRSATRMGETRSVAWYFQHPREHLAEHAADVRNALA